jgi:steroid delta-isomerase-like uncharacterized protein
MRDKEIVRSLYRAISDGDLEALGELIGDDVIEHEEFPGLAPTKEGVLSFFGMLRGAFPDLTMEPADIIGEGDKVCVRGTMAGTHTGDFMGIPSTGKAVSVAFYDIVRLRDGQIVEHWGLTDSETMMRQLGLLET